MAREDEIPRDEQAEASVLGAAMLKQAAAAEVVEALTASDFYVPKHATVFEAIRSLHARSEPVDAITVGDELHRAGALTGGVTLAFVHGLVELVPTASNVGYYVAIVQERAVLRRLMEAGDQIAYAAVAAPGEVDEIVERARALVDQVSAKVVTEVRWVGEGLEETYAQLREPAALGVMYPTPWDRLNGLLGGLRPGALYVLGARPGVGKSSIALNMAAKVASCGQAVGFVSLEMSEEELRRRLLAAEATVHLSGLLDSNLSASQWTALNEADEKLRSMRLSIYDTAATLSQVLSYARTMHRMGNLGLLVVDYLQLMQGDGRAESRQVEVSEFSRALKLLAKELQIPVLALSQLNRESASRKGSEPKITDLRESGSLEQDADVVLLLHRDERKASQLKVIVAKNRHGQPGDFTLTWEGQYARASALPWSPTALFDER